MRRRRSRNTGRAVNRNATIEIERVVHLAELRFAPANPSARHPERPARRDGLVASRLVRLRVEHAEVFAAAGRNRQDMGDLATVPHHQDLSFDVNLNPVWPTRGQHRFGAGRSRIKRRQRLRPHPTRSRQPVQLLERHHCVIRLVSKGTLGVGDVELQFF
jgi:hypothetical protein